MGGARPNSDQARRKGLSQFTSVSMTSDAPKTGSSTAERGDGRAQRRPDAKPRDARRGYAELSVGPAAPPHDDGGDAHRDQAERGQQAQRLIGGAKQLALVRGDADADDAIEQRLLCEALVAQQRTVGIDLDLAHARTVLRLAAHAPVRLRSDGR